MAEHGSLCQDLPTLRVCLIGGAGHSGSTLLGLILGSHSQSFYAGEAAKTRYLNQPETVLRKRSCKFCGLSCPVWGDFIIHPHQNLYTQIAQRVHRSLIIDSTKNIDWLQERIRELQVLGIPFFFIFLKRDGRAVVNSRLRKYPHRSPESIITDWQQQIQNTQRLFQSLSTPKMMINYEKLALNPVETTQTLCQFLGLNYETQMLNYDQHPHHVLGGNSGTQFLVAQSQGNLLQINANRETDSPPQGNHAYYVQQYQQHGAKIHLDLRWKRELSPTIQSQLQTLAAAEYQLMKWED
jgi:hypothetical protein